MRTFWFPVLLALAVAQPAPPPLDGVDLPEGFAETVLATGLTGATAMEIAPARGRRSMPGLTFHCHNRTSSMHR